MVGYLYFAEIFAIIPLEPAGKLCGSVFSRIVKVEHVTYMENLA